MYKSKNHGIAERFSWLEVDTSNVSGIKSAEESTDPTADNLEADERRYAQLVYVVNGGGSSGGGDASEATLLNIKAVVESDLDNQTLQQYVEENDTTGTIWVAEALPTATQLDAAWRVKRITPGVSGAGLITTTIEWAGGDSTFVHIIDIGGANASLDALF
jgi:hypothetical protein